MDKKEKKVTAFWDTVVQQFWGSSQSHNQQHVQCVGCTCYPFLPTVQLLVMQYGLVHKCPEEALEYKPSKGQINRSCLCCAWEKKTRKVCTHQTWTKVQSPVVGTDPFSSRTIETFTHLVIISPLWSILDANLYRSRMGHGWWMYTLVQVYAARGLAITMTSVIAVYLSNHLVILLPVCSVAKKELHLLGSMYLPVSCLENNYTRSQAVLVLSLITYSFVSDGISSSLRSCSGFDWHQGTEEQRH